MALYTRSKLLLLGFALMITATRGFAPRYMTPRHSYLTAASSSHDSDMTSFWKQRPGESDRAFYQRIQQAASSPQAFERTVREQQQAQSTGTTVWKAPLTDIPGLEDEEFGAVVVHTPSQASLEQDGSGQHSRPKGYQRAEEWEAEQSNKPKTSRWDERVQFDGLRHGNRFKQNEILRHHLHTY